MLIVWLNSAPNSSYSKHVYTAWVLHLFLIPLLLPFCLFIWLYQTQGEFQLREDFILF